MKKKIILIGAGLRGGMYSEKAMQTGEFEVVAVAEPVKERRDAMKEMHNIPDELCFNSWEPLLDMPKIADIAMICTMDRDHFEPTMAAIDKGYDIFLEKPISPSPEECVAIKKAAEEKGVYLMICFVLRYTPFFRTIKKLITDGKIGEVMNVQHAEDVGHEHQSHSFVRGNWGNSTESSFMLLQKSSHDMDIMQWLIDKPCVKVSSFGSLSHFRKENAPEGAPEYCIEGCPHADTCYYNAVKLYLTHGSGWFRTAATKNPHPTDADVEKAIRTTQYGKCVYKCNNDVVDHQVVNLEYEGGVTATFSMAAFNKGGRYIRVMGTKGVISGSAADNFVTLYSFDDKEEHKIQFSDVLVEQNITGGHGGGDDGIIEELRSLEKMENKPTGDFFNSASNHIIAFAAEASRITGQTVSIKEFTDSMLDKISK